MKRKNVLIILITLLGVNLCFAQTTTVYDSLVQFNEDLYQANFEFYISKGDTIYHGPFELTKQIEEISDDNSFKFSAITGHFNKDTPDKEWVIRQGDFTPSGKGAFKDYSYAFKINGSEFLAKGSFRNGEKNSPWELYEWNITNSNIQDTLLYAQIPFVKDKVFGKFYLYEKGETLEGSVDRNQFTENKWSFYITDGNGKKVLLKEWIFEENRLAKKILYENNEKLELAVSIPPNQETITEEIEVTKNYLTIIDLKTSINNPDIFRAYREKENIRDLFFDMMERFQSLDSLYSPITNVKISPVIKTVIHKFPYTDEEKELLDNLKENTENISELIADLKDDAQINLARLSTQEVAFYMSTIEGIEQQFLDYHRMIISHYDNGNLEYINRNLFIDFNTTIADNFDINMIFNNDTTKQKYTLQNYNVSKESGSLKKLSTFSNDLFLEINQMNDSVAVYVKEIKKEEKLSEIESVLIKKYDEVKALNDSIINEEYDKFAGFDVKKAIGNFIDVTLKNYSSLETTVEKSEQVESTLECLNQTETLLIKLQPVPENAYTVRDAYTNKVFNPYTYTEMEEKVKLPIYKSYEDYLLPGVFDNLNNLNCSNIKGFGKNFEVLFEEMINILKKNTSKEERKIKRAKDASKASEVLSFDLKF